MIRNFICKQQAFQIPPSVLQDESLPFPEVYCRQDEMVRLALAIKSADDSPLCVLPFCHTVEAEALGADIRHGNRLAGPRAGKPICTSLESLLALPDVDFSSGRIAEVLAACRALRDAGETVVLEVSGPLTILNALIEPHFIFRALRKQPAEMELVFEKLSRLLQNYIQQAEEAGANIFSFADPMADVSIIGPKVAEKLTRSFTCQLLKNIAISTKPNTLVTLCPKTALALTGCGCAEWEFIPLSAAMSYPKALTEVHGKAKFTGQACLKNRSTKLPGAIRALRLLNEERNPI